MKTSTYLLKEGYDNLKKNASKTFSTMLIIFLTLLVVGIFIVIFINVDSNITEVREQQGLQAFIKDGIIESDIDYARSLILQIEGVKTVDYISKEAAYQDALNVFGDQSYFLEGLEKVNPFPASFIIRFDNIEHASAIKEKVEKVENIYNVQYNEGTINAVVLISRIANIFLISVGSVMLIVSIFIIANTIKLAVYSNKREIYIMRYIGATNSFIRKPFIYEGIIMGFVSSLVAFMTISVTYVVLYARLPKFGTSLGIFGIVPYSQLWYFILITLIAIGLLIGVVGSALSLRKYLKV